MALPSALRYGQFRNYLAGTFVSNVGSNVQNWAISLHVYQLTDSSLMVGLLGAVRVVPLVLLTLFGGVLADHGDRRKIMLATQSAMGLVACMAFAVSVAGHPSVAALYVIVGLHSVARAFDGPARQAMFVTLVPARDFPKAASLNGVAWRLSDVLGPVLAGLFTALPGLARDQGFALCYGFNALSFLAVLSAVWYLPACRPESSGDKPKNAKEVLSQIGEGISFVKRTAVVRQAMTIDFWATLLSGADALLPAMATKVLKLNEFGYGLLGASSAVGALAAATALSTLPTIRNQGRVVVWMIGLFGLSTIGLGLAPNFWVAAICLAGVGASDMISTVLRQTIRQLATPDSMRGRMNATSSLFHISGPQLGDVEAGAVAALWGERVSIVIGGVLCMAVAGLWSRARELVGYRHEAEDEIVQ